MSGNNPVVPLGSPPESENEFKVYSRSEDVRFLTRAVQPPSSVYVDLSDVLAVGCASSQPNEVVTISYRLLRADGQLIKGQFQINPPSNRSIAVRQEPLAEGFLLSVSCKAAVATTRGQTFVRVFLTDPILGAGQPSYMLMADYVTTAMAPAHPNGRNLSPVEGPGAVYSNAFAPPAAGLDWSVTAPANVRWRPLAIVSQLTTSAAPGNRTPRLTLSISGQTILFDAGALVQPPSSTFLYTWANWGSISTDSAQGFNAPLPSNYFIRAGTIIAASTQGLAAGDQWTNQAFTIEEWMENV